MYLLNLLGRYEVFLANEMEFIRKIKTYNKSISFKEKNKQNIKEQFT